MTLFPHASSAADLTIGPEGTARMLVVADAEWMSPPAWKELPERQRAISSWRDPETLYLPYQAAVLLQDMVQRITGHFLPIERETAWEAEGRPPAVHIGRTREAVQTFGSRLGALERNGFLIRSSPGLLLVCGMNPTASYNGMGYLLEKYGGVDWFWPGELGVEAPQQHQLTFERLDVTFVPAIVFMSGTFGEWGAKIGEGRIPLATASHAMAPTYFHSGREHRPEWFSLVDGERLIPDAKNKYFTWQPCMAGPAPLKRLVTLTRHRLRDGQAPHSVGIGYNDGIWQPCECRFCLAADSGYHRLWDAYPLMSNGGRASSRYFQMISHLANELQPDYPALVVSGWSYAGTDIPPANVEKNPHLAMNVIGTKLAWLNPVLREWEERRLEQWGRLVGTLQTYDYFYQTGFIPEYVPHHYADVVRTLARLGVRHEYAETYQLMAIAGPKYWLHVKLCQDPSQDVDFLLQRWLSGMFQDAAEPMGRFYDTIEQAWLRYPYHGRHATVWSSYCFVYGTDLPILSPTDLTAMETALREAEAKDAAPRVAQRLAAVRAGFTLTREKALHLWKRRPVMDPEPYDPQLVREDWAAHLAGEPFFNPSAYYEEHCAPLIEQELFTERVGKQLPDRFDDAANRLSRVVHGVLASGEDAGSFAANAPAATREMLIRLADRSLTIPLVLPEDLSTLTAHGDLWLPPSSWETPAVQLQTARHPTTFRLGHDGASFRLVIDCQGKPEQDNVKLFLAPGHRRDRGFTLTISASGEITEYGEGYGSKYWHVGCDVETVTTADGWRAEVSIPYRALLYSPQEADHVIFNLWRQADDETSAWYPLPGGVARGPGGVRCEVTSADTTRLVETFRGEPLTALNGQPAERILSPTLFTHYVLTEPSEIVWEERGVRVSGQRSLFVGDELFELYPGCDVMVEVEYEGEGSCRPELGFYQQTSDGPLDVLDGYQAGELEHEMHRGQRVSRLTYTYARPRGQELVADTGRLRVLVEGAARVSKVRLLPRPAVKVELRLNSGGEALQTGRVVGLLASVTNLSSEPLTHLEVDISSVDGLDRRGCGLVAAAVLAPGETTHCLWWYVPTYGKGQARFNVVVDTEQLPRLIHRTVGP